MDDSTLAFRAELDRTRPAQRRLGYPLDLRQRVGKWAAVRHSEGVGIRRLAKDLGVSARSIKEWADSSKAPVRPKTAGFIPVQVDLSAVAGREADTLTLHAPGGYRVTGLGVEELVAVLRRLE